MWHRPATAALRTQGSENCLKSRASLLPYIAKFQNTKLTEMMQSCSLPSTDESERHSVVSHGDLRKQLTEAEGSDCQGSEERGRG